MRGTFSLVAALLAAFPLANGQTFTACNPTQKTCPLDPALGKTITTDFTQGVTDDWTLEDGTTVTHNENGANFVISQPKQAPTISSAKYIFFGKISAIVRAAPGSGIISSVILQSDDLDEIDLEWIGDIDSSVQTNFFGKGNTTTYDRSNITQVSNPVEEWYKYTIDWTPSAINWYINDTLKRTVNYGDDNTLKGKNYPQTPMRVKIGSWIGCADQAAASNPQTAGTCAWAGGPADWTKGPFTMLVKSVTVEDYGCATDYEYGDQSGSYQSIKSIGTCGKSSTSSASTTTSTTTSSTSIHHSTTISTSAHHTTTTTSKTPYTPTPSTSTHDHSRSAPAHDRSTTSTSSASYTSSTSSPEPYPTTSTTSSSSSSYSDNQYTTTTSSSSSSDNQYTPTTSASSSSYSDNQYTPTVPTTTPSVSSTGATSPTSPYPTYVGTPTPTAPYSSGNSTTSSLSYPSGYYTTPGGTGVGGIPTTFSSYTSVTTTSTTTSTSSSTVSPTIHPGAAQSLRSPRILDLDILALCLGVGYLIL